MLEVGLVHTSTLVVDEKSTALAMGSGDMEVLATPVMMALMENAAMLAVAGRLPEGSTTVGGHIESSHLHPSKVGTVVTATAVLEKIEGRKLYFHVEARQGEMVIGEGTHLRFMVDRERFLSKL
ncbi:MAG: thioesterase family protein [Phocaeicola sp.]|uniref:thioesterase family protein n=1 Tax=Phocaeicola sp. TaxID=2773926 RepID=UPI003F9FAF11